MLWICGRRAGISKGKAVSKRRRAKTQGNALLVAWQDIPRKKIHRHVFRLEKRIYRATQHGQVRTARKLQKLLMKSWYARLLAVRRVTQDNRGKHTAGIDGVKSLTPEKRLALANVMHCDGKATPLKSTRSGFLPNMTGHSRRSYVRPWSPNGKPSCRRRPMAFVQDAPVGTRLKPFFTALSFDRSMRSRSTLLNASTVSVMPPFWPKHRPHL